MFGNILKLQERGFYTEECIHKKSLSIRDPHEKHMLTADLQIREKLFLRFPLL